MLQSINIYIYYISLLEDSEKLSCRNISAMYGLSTSAIPSASRGKTGYNGCFRLLCYPREEKTGQPCTCEQDSGHFGRNPWVSTIEGFHFMCMYAYM